MTQAITQQLVQQRLTRFIEQDSNSTPYLIMTLFGDSIIPHGGEIWLGSLVQLLAPLGINERLVRTSVFRLTKDGWLKSHKKGRKSYYHACQVDEIERAEQKIYYQQEKWDGNWRFVIGVSMEKASSERDEFRKQLHKNGFSAIASNVFGHPTFSFKEIQQLLAAYGLSDTYIVVSGRDAKGAPMEYERVGRVLHRGLLNDLEQAYEHFIALYRSLYEHRHQLGELSTEDSFFLRTVMINDYRRVLWHDTARSNLLFDNNWAGRRARQMVASIYCAIEAKSSNHFESIGQNGSGSLLPAAARYRQRFKHLV